jgi:UDP-N-acetyl-2-amino-2-deoxyglucuronate dehydrogenase
VHPAIIELKEQIESSLNDKKYEVDLTYVTSRGNWYLRSWKGDEDKSGGIATNIGVHFFDLLHFLFGDVQENQVHINQKTKAAGYLEYEKARVRWFLSIDVSDVPKPARENGQTTFRSIAIDQNEVEFSKGFTDLHTTSYRKILSGHGFGLEENRVAIETVEKIRNAKIVSRGEMHPFVIGNQL